jgi:D-amino-acid dehydrogenase
LQGIARSAAAYFPRFAESDFSEISPWVGLRPCSPDGLPYIGRTSRAANLIVATGHAMLGLSLAPVTGQLIAAQLAGVATGLNSPLLSPDRYLGY